MPDYDDDEESFDHLIHAKKLLSQVYYRQNMYVMSAQWMDKQDLNGYLGPSIFVTGLASFLGFLASSSLVANNNEIRNLVSLASGFLGVMATSVRSTTKTCNSSTMTLLTSFARLCREC